LFYFVLSTRIKIWRSTFYSSLLLSWSFIPFRPIQPVEGTALIKLAHTVHVAKLHIMCLLKPFACSRLSGMQIAANASFLVSQTEMLISRLPLIRPIPATSESWSWLLWVLKIKSLSATPLTILRMQKSSMGITDGITITLRVMQQRPADVMGTIKMCCSNRKANDGR